MIADLIAANRSCRRFEENHPVDLSTLEQLVDLARLSASGANLQPLKYTMSCRPALNAEISKDFGVDHGIAAQSILLGARDKGLAGCMLGSLNRKVLRTVLDIPAHQ